MKIKFAARSVEGWQATFESIADKASWPDWLADLWKAPQAATNMPLELQRGSLFVVTDAGVQGVMNGNWIVRLESGAVLVMTDIVVAALVSKAKG